MTKGPPPTRRRCRHRGAPCVNAEPTSTDSAELAATRARIRDPEDENKVLRKAAAVVDASHSRYRRKCTPVTGSQARKPAADTTSSTTGPTRSQGWARYPACESPTQSQDQPHAAAPSHEVGQHTQRDESSHE